MPPSRKKLAPSQRPSIRGRGTKRQWLQHPHIVRIARWIAPEGIVLKLGDQIAWQQVAAFLRPHATADGVQAGRADPTVELASVELNIVEVVPEQVLTDEVIDGRQRVLRFDGE